MAYLSLSNGIFTTLFILAGYGVLSSAIADMKEMQDHESPHRK